MITLIGTDRRVFAGRQVGEGHRLELAAEDLPVALEGLAAAAAADEHVRVDLHGVSVPSWFVRPGRPLNPAELIARATLADLAEPYDVTIQAVSKHVKVLEDAGVVRRSRDAQRRPVHLEAEVLDLMTAWIERYRQTEATLDPDVPIIRVVREFDAPPDKVFRAHTDPDLLLQWYGPADTKTTIDHHVARPGGSFRYVHGFEDAEFVLRGCFHEVRAPRAHHPDRVHGGRRGSVMLCKMVLADLDDGRTAMTLTMLVDSFAVRDATGMEDGMRQSYERLDALLA